MIRCLTLLPWRALKTNTLSDLICLITCLNWCLKLTLRLTLLLQDDLVFVWSQIVWKDAICIKLRRKISAVDLLSGLLLLCNTRKLAKLWCLKYAVWSDIVYKWVRCLLVWCLHHCLNTWSHGWRGATSHTFFRSSPWARTRNRLQAETILVSNV